MPADIVLLKTSEKSGTCFIRTDQLDGETDWKLRVAVSTTQNSEKISDLLDIGAQIYAEKPQLRINAFEGIFIRVRKSDQKNLNIFIFNKNFSE